MQLNQFIAGTSIRRETTYARNIQTSFLHAGSGRYVVLIHGGGSGAIAWQPVIQSLSGHFHVIAPDVVGYGESAKPHASYDRSFFCRWLSNFLDALSLEQVDLVGHSLGGAIAIQFALDHPERVARLVLVNSGAIRFYFPFTPFVYGMWLYSFPSIKASWHLHNSLIYQREQVNQTLVEYAAEICRKPGGKRAYWLGCWKALVPFTTSQLQSICQPTLIVWGAYDRVFPVEHSRAAQVCIPNAILEIIPDAGHIPFYDTPEIFNRLLQNFLGSEPCPLSHTS